MNHLKNIHCECKRFLRRGFETQRLELDGHFFTLICCLKLYCLFKKTEYKPKRGRGWPIKKDSFIYFPNHGC